MSRRHHEPNASHYSARYAERKRAAQRARDLAAPPRTCNRCPVVCVGMSIFCAEHAAEYEQLQAAWSRGEKTMSEVLKFTDRTHWPVMP